MKYDRILWGALTLILAVFLLGAVQSATAAETTEETTEKTKQVKVCIMAPGEEEAETLWVLTLEDLEDGGTRTISKGNHQITVTREGDVLLVKLDAEEGAEGKVSLYCTGADEDQFIWVSEGDGEQRAVKRVLILTETEEGAAKKHCIVKKVRLEGDVEASEFMSAAVFVGEDGKVVVNGERGDADLPKVSVLGDEVTIVLDEESLGRMGEAKVLKLRELGLLDEEGVLSLKELGGVITADLEGADLEGLSEVEALCVGLDVEVIGDAGAEKNVIVIRQEAKEDTEDLAIYRCPEDGVEIRMLNEEDVKSKYKCPVCRTKMVKVENL